jgi:GntR family transcriptional regulator, arabinose operon transcriptional repressor
MRTRPSRTPKHRLVRAELERDLRLGRWSPGEKLPSEAELVRRFEVSRITVGRAVRDLVQAGLVARRAGAGTFAAAPAAGGLSFGLLIPDLGETEVFEPICQGIMASPLAREHALVWGSATASAPSRSLQALELCRQYIEREVSGVFFAPLELDPEKDEVNERITSALDQAGIPLILLDRTSVPYPGRGHHDLVGLDNRRAGALVTEHLLGLGARRVAFVGRPWAASTVDERAAGYREAHFARGLPVEASLVVRLDPTDGEAVRRLMVVERPEAIVAANDWTAARLMQHLTALGYAVPGDVRLVGIDDLDYSGLLPVPLTTVRQPTRQIGAAALSMMLDRVSGAAIATRDVLLQGALVVRRSCGAASPGT